jgi:hypothetical protein
MAKKGQRRGTGKRNKHDTRKPRGGKKRKAR